MDPEEGYEEIICQETDSLITDILSDSRVYTNVSGTDGGSRNKGRIQV